MLDTKHVLEIKALSSSITPSLSALAERGNTRVDNGKFTFANSTSANFTPFGHELVGYELVGQGLDAQNFLMALGLPMVAPGRDKSGGMTIVSMAGVSPSGNVNTYFIWDGQDILVETDGNDSIWVN